MRNSKTLTVPEVATGQTPLAALRAQGQEPFPLASPFTDKRKYGERWEFSPRKVDDLLAAGMPHLKIGKRRVRINIPEADDWMMRTFGTQRRGKLNGAAR